VITVHALNPSSVVNKNVSCGLSIKMFNNSGWSDMSIIYVPQHELKTMGNVVVVGVGVEVGVGVGVGQIPPGKYCVKHVEQSPIIESTKVAVLKTKLEYPYVNLVHAE